MQARERLRRLLARRPLLLAAAIGLHWLTALWVGLRAHELEVGARELVAAGVLGPLALLAAFDLTARAGGAALGAWTLLVWVTAPVLAPAFTLSSYDPTLRDDVLPLAVGLTSDAGYLEGVALLVALALGLRGTRATVAGAGLVLAGLLVVWLSRLPLPDPSLDAFDANMAGLREYFWSQRLIQWLPLAGVVAVARRSAALAAALAAWLGAYVALRATNAAVGFDDGELFRALLPAFPAYILLVAALPLLVPTLAARLEAFARPAS